MALPKLNETLKFQMKIPSSGKVVKYRPYLVKEEKILLQAFESKDTQMSVQALVDTINACVDEREKIDAAKLATFDVEYMFVKLRAKSVGETSKIYIRCKECEHTNEYLIDLDTIEMDMPENNNKINITEDVIVELQYPTYDSVMGGSLAKIKEDPLEALKIMAKNIVAIYTKEERIDAKNEKLEDLENFLTSMTSTQLQNLMTFFNNLPALKHKAVFSCEKCQTVNELELKGIADFF